MTAIAVPSSRLLGRALLAVSATLVLLALIFMVGAVVLHTTESNTALPLADITGKPTLVAVGDRTAIAVKVDGVSYAFVPVDARNDPVTYCEGRFGPGIFVTRYWASQFTLDGRKIGGPAPRMLDRYETTVRGSELVVRPHHVVRAKDSLGPDTPPVKWNDRRTLDPGWCPPRDVVDRLTSPYT